MLSIQSLGKVSKEKVAYYTELAATGYYTEAEEPAGKYFGKLASVLKLDKKTVTQDDLQELAKGFDTKGKALVANAGEEHRMGMDLTFSAPKSVSVCFGLAGADLRVAIQTAHENAVKTALKYAEQHFVQVRQGFEDNKQRRIVTTGNALFALFEHGSSRSNDPMLHTHALLLNFSKVANGEFRCLESPEFFNHKKALGALYRCELAHQLEKLGFETEPDDEFFKLAVTPDELCTLFSKRSNEIKELLDESGFGRANAKLKQHATLFTRQKKSHISRDTLYQNWSVEAEQVSQWKPEQSVKAHIEPRQIDKTAFLESLTEKQSLFTYPDLLENVFIHFQHSGLPSCEAEAFAKNILESDEIRQINHPQAGLCYTTEHQYQLEMNFYKNITAYAAQSGFAPTFIDTDAALAAHSLNEEQQLAFNHICRSYSNVALLNGAPGTGKSYLLKAVKSAYQMSKYNVIGCSLAASAAEELEKSSGINSQTIDSLLVELETGRKLLKRNSVIIIDEAGMCGVKKLSKLYQFAQQSNSKLILVGDHNQLSPIESGLAFSNLINTLPAAYLNDIQRQKAKRDRDNVRLIEQGKSAKVLMDLKSRGLLTFDTDKTRCKFKLVDDWFKVSNGNFQNALILASTRYDVADLNLIARAKLLDAGKLSAVSAQMTNHENEQLTIAEGERIMFRSNSRKLDVKNGSTGIVTDISQNRRTRNLKLTVLLDNGKQVEVNTADYNEIEYGYAMSIHKSQGKTVDNSFVWLNEKFLNKELNYVQMSRARLDTRAYGASALEQELDYWNIIADKGRDNRKKADLVPVINAQNKEQYLGRYPF